MMQYLVYENKGNSYTAIPFMKHKNLFSNNFRHVRHAQRKWSDRLINLYTARSNIIGVACCRCVCIFSLKLYESPSLEG